ncbi:acid-activated periplasmic chaperone HdeA [Microbulbifer sp. CnH-101-G]|uniref:acid-activated periplasmic chaperone HdeA n=1 Tax=Microbulbifer sp. CnH-101-G TaxID=3243393 RepID=UPI00403A4538
MKSTHYILPLVIASLAASAALADKHPKKPAKDWTCADFLAIDDEFKPKAVYWAAAYSKRGKEEGDMLDIDGTEKVTPMIITACTKAPKESFWTKFKDEWHKMGRHHGKDKSDKMMNMQGGSGTNNTGTSPNGTTNPGTTPNGTNDGSGNNNMQKQQQNQ